MRYMQGARFGQKITVQADLVEWESRLKINYLIFAVSRAAHGVISAAITAVLLKTFNIPLSVPAEVRFARSYSTLSLSISMLCMVIILIITIYTKNSTGKILDDIV